MRIHIQRVDFYCVCNVPDINFKPIADDIHGHKAFEGPEYYYDSKQLRPKVMSDSVPQAWAMDDNGLLIRLCDMTHLVIVRAPEKFDAFKRHLAVRGSREGFEANIIIPYQEQLKKNKEEMEFNNNKRAAEDKKRKDDSFAEYNNRVAAIKSGDRINVSIDELKKWREYRFFIIPLHLSKGFNRIRHFSFNGGKIAQIFKEQTSTVTYKTAEKIAAIFLGE